MCHPVQYSMDYGRLMKQNKGVTFSRRNSTILGARNLCTWLTAGTRGISRTPGTCRECGKESAPTGTTCSTFGSASCDTTTTGSTTRQAFFQFLTMVTDFEWHWFRLRISWCASGNAPRSPSSRRCGIPLASPSKTPSISATTLGLGSLEKVRENQNVFKSA